VVPRPGAKSFAASLVVLAGVLALSAPARGAAASPFREVAVGNGVRAVQSDGVRFAWGQPSGSGRAVRVFDTLRRRNFRLEAPRPECSFGSIGGGLAVWSCYSPETMLLTNLSTGRSREPAGIDQLKQMAQPMYIGCRPLGVGRYWLGFSCGNGFGPGDDPYYLNHRTGRLTGGIRIEEKLFSPDAPFLDLDYASLFRPYCAPLGAPADGSHGPPYLDYAPPFALYAPLGPGPYGPSGTRFGSIRLRRCGTKRAEILTRCPQTDCRTPQLGSDYVTWGEYKRVYAYLPRIRRRLLIGRAPAHFVRGRKLSVAHTCNSIFARWGPAIYEARFEPRQGAPPCQAGT
jgi:hypothetical protein